MTKNLSVGIMVEPIFSLQNDPLSSIYFLMQRTSDRTLTDSLLYNLSGFPKVFQVHEHIENNTLVMPTPKEMKEATWSYMRNCDQPTYSPIKSLLNVPWLTCNSFVMSCIMAGRNQNKGYEALHRTSLVVQ